MQIQTLKLHKGREQSVLRFHPWVFSRAIQSPVVNTADGDLVNIADHKGNIVGVGHFQNSSLSVRLLAFEETVVDTEFWLRRIHDAARYRTDLQLHQPGYTEAFRLVHGEGDQLPGLIIDVYKNVAVVQAHSIGMHKARHDIAKALLALTDPKINVVYCKSKEALPGQYAAEVEDEWLTETTTDELTIFENGIPFVINVVTGQKTGFFLDQRENRALVQRYSHDKKVLNCFCYTGGFSLYALHGGATHVTSIDTSGTALDILEKNLLQSGIQGRHTSLKENVMTWLTHSEDMFDIVIVDPPAFAKSLSKRHNAIQAYKRLNMMAIARVKQGGMLFTYSCSQVVDKETFHHTIVAAAIEAGRQARVVHEMSQGPDHPVSIFHPEGHYLKGLALYID